MPNLTPVPAAPPAPPGPSASSSSPGNAPAASFQDVLTNHQARTDTPEGHAGGNDQPRGDHDTPKPTGPAADDTTKPADPAKDATEQALAAALAAVPAQAVPAQPVSVAQTPAAAAAATGTAVPAAPGAVVAALAGAAAKQAPGSPAGPVPAATAATAPATDQQLPQAPAAGAATDPGTPQPAAPAAAGARQAAQQAAPAVTAAPAPAPAQPPTADQAAAAVAAPATPSQDAQPQTTTGQQQQQGAGQDAPAAQVVAQPVPAPQAAAQAAPIPVAPAANPIQHVPGAVPIRTAEAVERIHALVQLANGRGGVAQARLALHPAELGGVTVELRVTDDGLHAHIAADRPEALPLLQQAGGDLRKALGDRGIDVHHLDFGMHPDAEAGAWQDQGRAQQELAGDFRGLDTPALEEDPAAEVSAQTTTTGVEPPAGALVDVHA